MGGVEAREEKAVNLFLSLIRLLLGGLFLFSGASKALDPMGFAQAIESFRILPYLPAVLLAFYLPYLELLCGACLLLRRLTTGSLLLILGMTLLFAAAILSAWVRGLEIRCGCFGSLKPTTHYAGLLVRDLLLSAGALTLLWKRGPSSYPQSGSGMSG